METMQTMVIEGGEPLSNFSQRTFRYELLLHGYHHMDNTVIALVDKVVVDNIKCNSIYNTF